MDGGVDGGRLRGQICASAAQGSGPAAGPTSESAWLFLYAWMLPADPSSRPGRMALTQHPIQTAVVIEATEPRLDRSPPVLPASALEGDF